MEQKKKKLETLNNNNNTFIMCYLETRFNIRKVQIYENIRFILYFFFYCGNIRFVFKCMFSVLQKPL